MRYRLMATYRGVSYEAGVGPTDADVVLFASSPPPDELGFEPAAGYWRKWISRAELDALWESRPIGRYRSEPCLVLEEIGDRLHITYLGHDAYRAERLGFWQVDRGVYEVVVPHDEVTGLSEERVDYQARRAVGDAPPDVPPRHKASRTDGDLPIPDAAPVPEAPPAPERSPSWREFEMPDHSIGYVGTDWSGNGDWNGSAASGGISPPGRADPGRGAPGWGDASTVNGSGTANHTPTGNGALPAEPSPNGFGTAGDSGDAGRSSTWDNLPPSGRGRRGTLAEADGRSADDRPGQGGAGQGGTGQGGTDQGGTDQGGGPDQRGPDQLGPDQLGPDQLGTARRADWDDSSWESTGRRGIRESTGQQAGWEPADGRATKGADQRGFRAGTPQGTPGETGPRGRRPGGGAHRSGSSVADALAGQAARDEPSGTGWTDAPDNGAAPPTLPKRRRAETSQEQRLLPGEPMPPQAPPGPVPAPLRPAQPPLDRPQATAQPEAPQAQPMNAPPAGPLPPHSTPSAPGSAAAGVPQARPAAPPGTPPAPPPAQPAAPPISAPPAGPQAAHSTQSGLGSSAAGLTSTAESATPVNRHSR